MVHIDTFHTSINLIITKLFALYTRSQGHHMQDCIRNVMIYFNVVNNYS